MEECEVHKVKFLYCLREKGLLLCAGFVEVTSRTRDLVDQSRGLESVGQDNVGVHSAHIKMVDHGFFKPVWSVS